MGPEMVEMQGGNTMKVSVKSAQVSASQRKEGEVAE